MTPFKSNFRGEIKIFSDGADRAGLLEMNADPRIAGMTTNPSLMKKAGVKANYRAYCQEILTQIQQKPISFEVFADDLSGMERQALDIKTWGPNVYVKVPVMNSEGKSTLSLVHSLAHSGVKLNVTAVFTMNQVIETAQALKGGAPSILSVFAGRIADTGRDPVPLMKASSEICRGLDKNIELLWASTREAYNFIQAEESGCHIITAPIDIIKKMSGFDKDLFEMSRDTVRTFKADSDAAGFAL